VINQNQRAELLAYLAEKRRLSSALAARSSSIRAG